MPVSVTTTVTEVDDVVALHGGVATPPVFCPGILANGQRIGVLIDASDEVVIKASIDEAFTSIPSLQRLWVGTMQVDRDPEA